MYIYIGTFDYVPGHLDIRHQSLVFAKVNIFLLANDEIHGNKRGDGNDTYVKKKGKRQ